MHVQATKTDTRPISALLSEIATTGFVTGMIVVLFLSRNSLSGRSGTKRCFATRQFRPARNYISLELQEDPMRRHKTVSAEDHEASPGSTSFSVAMLLAGVVVCMNVCSALVSLAMMY